MVGSFSTFSFLYTIDLIGNTCHYAVMATVRSFELVTTNAVVECDDKSGRRCDSFQRFDLKIKYSENATEDKFIKISYF